MSLINNYAWSKLGGESSVIMYKNSLILRASITEKPFVHKVAFVDFKTNFIFHEDLVPKIMKVLNYKGVLNVGGKSQSVYNFVKKWDGKGKNLILITHYSIITAVTNAVPSSGEIVIADKNFKVLGTIQTD